MSDPLTPRPVSPPPARTRPPASTRRRRIAALVASAGVLAFSTACGSDGPTAAEGAGEATLTIRLSQASAAGLVAEAMAAAVGGPPGGVPEAGNVARADVTSLTATLVGIQLARTDDDGEADETEGGGVTLALDAPVPLDLMALPATLEEAIVVERGELPAGTYRNLRLQVVETAITFARDVTIGPRTWAGGEVHPLRIAGPADAVLRVPTAVIELAAGEAETLDLVFEPGTTLGSITANPQFVIAGPVLRGEVRR